ncbi:hypothetical protein AVEN_4766-1 [Araneus ventricosus]|uniref:Uncharacterized protein n=1 Tax=Araneus ventricosus TaxID=182803 RepID=A0A4Y2G1K8_ARAVE|nr:hypothetical protein AVEN_4766-1 [Araneus ventricosus]
MGILDENRLFNVFGYLKDLVGTAKFIELSTIDRTIDNLVKEKNTRNISSGTQTRHINSVCPNPPQTDPFYRCLDSGGFGHFTGEK